MATIVKHKKTGEVYALLGAGLGMYKATRPSFFGGDLFPHEEEGVERVIAVCDEKGDILFIDSNLLKVIEIDGVEISKLNLYSRKSWDNQTGTYNVCPACAGNINKYDKECPECGLVLK